MRTVSAEFENNNEFLFVEDDGERGGADAKADVLAKDLQGWAPPSWEAWHAKVEENRKEALSR